MSVYENYIFSLLHSEVSGRKELRIPPICRIRGRLINHSRHLRGGVYPARVEPDANLLLCNQRLYRSHMLCSHSKVHIFIP